MLDDFDPLMFPTTVVIHAAGETVSPQGAVGPAPGAGRAYRASVQPQGVMPSDRAAGVAEVPTASWSHNVYLPVDPADTLIPSLRYGDQVDVLDARGRTLVTVLQGPAEDLDFQGRAWWLKCLATTQ